MYFKCFLKDINPGSKLHKVSDGMYFINGKIIICRIGEQVQLKNIKY